uniref:Transposase Tc1-like domain-containing protein n=1 Tax=Amphiprion percula TaxID=161767 RepID=A0A3P8TVV3_AMPPE
RPSVPATLMHSRLQVGSRQSDVACELGVSQSVISRFAARHKTTGSVWDRPRSGAPRVMDRNDDQYLRTYALTHRYATATQLQACLREVRGTRVSRQTIRNRLHCFGLNARQPLQVTPLTPRHRRDHLQWAQEHVTWTMQQWSTVLFTGECRVTLHRNDAHQHCWRSALRGWSCITSRTSFLLIWTSTSLLIGQTDQWKTPSQLPAHGPDPPGGPQHLC